MKNEEPIRWITVNGRHIPLYEGQSVNEAIKENLIKKNKESAQKLNASNHSNHYKFHQEQVKKLESSKYEDGTYNVGSLKPVSFEKGYQFTFCQIGDDYSELEYNRLVNSILGKIEDKNAYAGKFESSPEISFHTNDLKFALEIARRYNQISIWDWQECKEIKTGGTGRRR